ncbi:Metal-dependent hydrolases of the beta-lactamase superfamily I; PhnP protein [hydrothermal vent metagenome]|uniref:Metal-dependent hydrolases of the beta-lactamase superfamily I PhnP protein n=1 Tax=hydrothermal vent metagenome TaxID=652676 RepID=A0A3B1DB49_9ZZZZ
MKILFLGTGTSTGVPSLCCDCEVCLSRDPKNKRLRASILASENGHNILIDTSTDLRQQSLTHRIQHIDHVLFTHHHADHVHGIDELRSFNHFNKTVIPCYANEPTVNELKKKFSYIFSNGAVQTGGGLPQLTLETIAEKAFNLGGVEVDPLEITHGKMTITGYKINNTAYITDCSDIPEKTRKKLFGLDLLIINALGFLPHPTHFNLDQALEAIAILKPKRALLTHINHKYDHQAISKELPRNVELAYDGLTVEV